ncbi:MAG: NADH-quinone oxidoreductase subunit N [Bacteroidetes bacterium]|nr:MAG: NADH-quinone oxidoreductase subunit N [Bacteroidota bacterium]
MLSLILLSSFGIANLFLGFLRQRNIVLFASIAFTFITLVVSWLDSNGALIPFPANINNGMMATSNITTAFSMVLLLTALLIFPLSEHYLKDKEAQPAEYYAILLFSLVGALMMVTYQNLIMLFVGVEILSVSMYVLTGADKRNLKSNEAALKYFLMGAFATGILLFGMALLYGASNGFTLKAIEDTVKLSPQNMPPMLALGFCFMLIGILFKISAAPFHFWTPDVYEGAPSFFTAFMSTIVKTAGISALLKFLIIFAPAYLFWYQGLLGVIILTLLVGNVTAVYQNSFKRMLAYSGISHAGYLLLAVACVSAVRPNDKVFNAVLFYSLAYSISTIAAFGGLMAVAGEKRKEDYAYFNGLGKTNPFLALSITISMLSLAGIPLTAGFFGKLFIFTAVYQKGLYFMLIVAVLMSSIGIYYYFRVIIAMYMKEGNGKPVEVSSGTIATLMIANILTILLGLAPDLWLNLFQ